MRNFLDAKIETYLLNKKFKELLDKFTYEEVVINSENSLLLNIFGKFVDIRCWTSLNGDEVIFYIVVSDGYASYDLNVDDELCADLVDGVPQITKVEFDIWKKRQIPLLRTFIMGR